MRRELENFGVGVVGTGFMGTTHVEALRRLGLNVIGICGSTPEKSKQAGKRLGIESFENFDHLLDHPRVDCLHLTVPNHLHFSLLKKTLEAHKHALCEKPLVLNAQQAREIVALSQNSPSVVGVNYNLRYYPLCLEAKERIRRGDLGRLTHLSGGYLQDWLLYDSDYNWRVCTEQGGPLRAIADIGTHWMDMIQFVTGSKIQSLCAELSRVHPTRIRPQESSGTFSSNEKTQGERIDVETEDFGLLWVRLENGVLGSALISQVAAGRKNHLHFEIHGSQASLGWNGETPNELWLGHRNKPNEKLTKDPSLMNSESAKFCGYPPGHAEGYPDTFKQCFEQFYGYLSSDRKDPMPFPTLEDGQWEIELCDAILRSHKAKAWVNVKGENW